MQRQASVCGGVSLCPYPMVALSKILLYMGGGGACALAVFSFFYLPSIEQDLAVWRGRSVRLFYLPCGFLVGPYLPLSP